MPSVKFVKTFGRPTLPAAAEGMEQLKQQLGVLGEPAAERAEWTAVAHWLNGRPEGKLDPVANSRHHQAIIHYMNARAAQSGIPSSTGDPMEAPYLSFHRSRQSRIKKIAMELLGYWRAAGEPWLAQSIRQVSDHMEVALRRAKQKSSEG